MSELYVAGAASVDVPLFFPALLAQVTLTRFLALTAKTAFASFVAVLVVATAITIAFHTLVSIFVLVFRAALPMSFALGKGVTGGKSQADN